MRPRPRDLADAAFIASLDDARLYRSIAYGPPGAPMPGHLEGYDPPAMWALVEIVRLVAGRPATGPYEDDLWPFEPAPRGPAAKAPGPRVPPAPPSAP